jgi:hypothetical protein
MALVQVRQDDLDGSTDDVQPVAVGWNGQLYALDLGRENRDRLEEALAEFLAAAYAFGDMPVPPQSPIEEVKARTPAIPAPDAKASTEPTPAPRKRPAKKTASRKAAPDAPAATPQAIRQWAADNGVEMSPTGAIPKRVRALYEETNA